MRAMRVPKHHQRTREMSPEGQEDLGELPVPEDQPAVYEPLQAKPLLTRLRAREALRRPERLIDNAKISIYLRLWN